MKHLLKCFSVIAISSCVFGNSETSMPQAQMSLDPNPQARWGNKNRFNTFLTGEMIWLKPLNSEIAKETSNSSSYTFFKYNFQPGVRLALGFNTAYDGWDTILTYTGLRYKHNNNFIYNTTLNGATKYTYYFDQGDLDVGRMFKISSQLKIRPHFGVRSLWLTQKGSWKYFNDANDDNYHDTARLKGTLVGGEIGCDSFWKLAKDFGIYANVTACTLVEAQRAIFTQYNETSSTLEAVSKSDLGSKITNGLDFAIGIRWDITFSDGDYHFAFNAGYEHHSLINVNSYADLEVLGSSAPYLTQTDTDFSLQGIALGIRFDF